MDTDYLLHLAAYSDGVIYALAALMLLALAVMLDRFWFLRRSIVGGARVVRGLARLAELHPGEIELLRRAAGRLPEAAIIDAAARHHGQAHGEALANRLDEAIMLTAPTLDRRLWVLDTIVTLAPLLGLFGTILGMFHAFGALARPGAPPTAITGGVADALVTTAVGIFIAMVGLLSYNGFNNQIRTILLQLDTVKMMLINRMDGAPLVPLGARAPAAAPRTEEAARPLREARR